VRRADEGRIGIAFDLGLASAGANGRYATSEVSDFKIETLPIADTDGKATLSVVFAKEVRMPGTPQMGNIMQESQVFRISTTSNGDVSQAQARSELDRLLGDPEFHCSDRNKNFLKFVAEETFAGRDQALKAYTIAVDVFGRPPSFDASTDPIVRIEATRLRAALARYYEQAPTGSVAIELPKGRYVPNFYREKRTSEAAAPTNYVQDEEGAARAVTVVSSRLRPSSQTKWLALTLGLAGGALLGVLAVYPRNLPWGSDQRFSERPVVSVEFDSTAGLNEASQMQDALLVGLSRFQSLKVLSSDHTQAVSAEDQASQFRIVVKYRASANQRSFWWQVIDRTDNEAVESGETRGLVSVPPTSEELDDLTRRLSLRLAGGRGVINSRILARELENPTLGHGCLIRAVRALQISDTRAMADAESCLQLTVDAQPSYADAQGVLALFSVRKYRYDEPSAELEGALQMARDASVQAPDSSNVAYARMTLEFLLGRADTSIDVGRHALEINPHNGAVTARLAQILYFTGDRDEGLVLARQANLVDGIVYRDAELTLGLEAYMQRRYADALHHLERAGREVSYGPAMLKVAILGHTGPATDLAAAKQTLLRSWPRFELTFNSMMDRIETAPELREALIEGLHRAGLNLG
jgi:tetratricopeptide (TPR) repeat protein